MPLRLRLAKLCAAARASSPPCGLSSSGLVAVLTHPVFTSLTLISVSVTPGASWICVCVFKEKGQRRERQQQAAIGLAPRAMQR
jgi:hypothetical protein